MPPRPTQFLEKLTSYLSYFEIIALLVSFVGLTLLYLNVTGSRQLILVGFTALAIIYFLLAFTLPPVSESENENEPERGGFLDLFFKIIARKVIYLGCSVSTIGLLFGLLGMRGSNEMLEIGTSTLLICVLLCGLAMFINNATLRFLQSPLLRAVPIGLLSGYWLYLHWPLPN